MTAAHRDRRPPPWTWDEAVLACDLVVANDWRALTAADPKVIELSELLQKLPIHPPEVRGTKFRNPNGVGRKTVDLATNHPAYAGVPTNGGRVDREVIKAFIDNPTQMAETAAALRRVAATAGPQIESPEDLDMEDEAADEGRVLQRMHLRRERDPKLRARKIKQARKDLGYVRCEVCAFDFEQTYGARGHDYIECHHKAPLSQTGPTKTALSDLALLCSNCHRMIHRRQPWITVEELRQLVDANVETTWREAPSASSV